jgi:hypothetical protein
MCTCTPSPLTTWPRKLSLLNICQHVPIHYHHNNMSMPTCLYSLTAVNTWTRCTQMHKAHDCFIINVIYSPGKTNKKVIASWSNNRATWDCFSLSLCFRKVRYHWLRNYICFFLLGVKLWLRVESVDTDSRSLKQPVPKAMLYWASGKTGIQYCSAARKGGGGRKNKYGGARGVDTYIIFG